MIKNILAVFFLAAATSFAAGVPDGVPKGAEETKPGVYRFVDKDGKAWIYRRTPFGISKRAEEQETSAAKEAAPSGERSRMTPFGETNVSSENAERRPAARTPQRPTKVIDEGDQLRFERQSPLGVYKWTRNKDELTAEERRLWEDQRNSDSSESKTK